MVGAIHRLAPSSASPNSHYPRSGTSSPPECRCTQVAVGPLRDGPHTHVDPHHSQDLSAALAPSLASLHRPGNCLSQPVLPFVLRPAGQRSGPPGPTHGLVPAVGLGSFRELPGRLPGPHPLC